MDEPSRSAIRRLKLAVTAILLFLVALPAILERMDRTSGRVLFGGFVLLAAGLAASLHWPRQTGE